MMFHRVPLHNVSSLDEVADFVTAQPDAQVLIFDADNTLAPQGIPPDHFSLLVDGAIDRFQAHPAVNRVIVLTNGPERGVARITSRGNKPWTTRRRLALQGESRIVVIGDQVLTDGLLAWRFGATFLHLVIDEAGEATRQATMRGIGKVVTALFFRNP